MKKKVEVGKRATAELSKSSTADRLKRVSAIADIGLGDKLPPPLQKDVQWFLPGLPTDGIPGEALLNWIMDAVLAGLPDRNRSRNPESVAVVAAWDDALRAYNP